MRAAHYNDKTFVNYTKWNNAEITLVPMIENPAGLADLDAICAHPDVKMIGLRGGRPWLFLERGHGHAHGRQGAESLQKPFSKPPRKHNVAVIGGPILNATPGNVQKGVGRGGQGVLARPRFPWVSASTASRWWTRWSKVSPAANTPGRRSAIWGFKGLTSHPHRTNQPHPTQKR